MAYNFFGVYFEDSHGVEYRCGFHDDNAYMPQLEKRVSGVWTVVARGNGVGNANTSCRDIRANLPITVPFINGHTQNERMELINQIVYNLNRKTTERVNYRGAHV